MTWQEDLRKHMEKNGKYGDPDAFVEHAEIVLRFFAERVKTHEPYATRAIAELEGAADQLSGYEDKYT